MSSLISVIIPAYNVEGYIRRCLDSLVNQTYKNIEIIVVDDGSTDRTGEIVKEYVDVYPGKVVLFQKENEGQAEARNYGLSHATGKYIGFVDSDDFVSTQMYEKMIAVAEEDGCDLVTCGYYGCDDETGEISVYQTGYKGEFNQSIYENPLLLRINSPYPWNKLYLRSLLDEVDFQFKKGMIFEDLCAVFPLFLDVKKIGRVHEKLYYYIKNRKGGTIRTFNKKHGQIIDALKIMNDAYKDRGMFETYYDTLLFFNIRHIFARFDEMKKYDDEDFKKSFESRAYELLDSDFPNWRQSEEYKNFCSGDKEEANADEEDSFDEIKEEKVQPKKKKKALKRSELFEKYVEENGIQKNTVLIECYHGNDIRGTGYYAGKLLDEKGGYKIYMAASDEDKARKFEQMYSYNWEFIDVNSEKYLEVLASSQYVVNNRAFPAYYRKRKGQYYIFTDFLPSVLAQGKETTYGMKNMQGIQFSLAQADAILYPSELEGSFESLLDKYDMKQICAGKGVFISVSGFYQKPTKTQDEDIKIAYMPDVKAFPGLKDPKNFLFLSELKKKLTQLDEQIVDGRKLVVCFPRVIRRRFRENIWKHIDFFPKEMEPYEYLAGCQALVGENSEALYVMKAMLRPVCRFSDNANDTKWSLGIDDNNVDEFETFDDLSQMAHWINGVQKQEDNILPNEYVEPKLKLKTAKNGKIKRNIIYVPSLKHKNDFVNFMNQYDANRSLFFFEKDQFDDHMAAWVREYKQDIMFMVIIRSIVVSVNESRKIKYKLTTKDKLRQKRDEQRYLGK